MNFGAVYLTRVADYNNGVIGSGSVMVKSGNNKYSFVTFTTDSNGACYLAIFHSSYDWDENKWNTAISYFKDAMFTEGTEQYPYEPYGVSPSPDYPSEIKSTGCKNLFKGIFRQGNILGDTSQLTRLTSDDNYYIEKGKTYTFSTNAPDYGFKYGINTATTEFPLSGGTTNRNYDSGWQTTKSFTFTATVSGYLGVPFAKTTDTQNISLNEIKDCWFVLAEGSVAVNNPIEYGKYGIEVFQRNKNYFIYTGDYRATGFGGYLDTDNTLNGINSIRTVNAWSGPHLNLKKHMEESDLKVGDTVTYSIYFKTNFVPTRNMGFTAYRFTSASGNGSISVPVADIKPGEWKRISFTFTLTEYSLTAATARLETDYYDTSDAYYFGNNRENYVWFSCPQLEKGSVMTEWKLMETKATMYQLDAPLRSLPNGVKDVAYIKNGKFYVDRYIGKHIFEAVSSLTLHNGNYYGTNSIAYNTGVNSPNILSNRILGKYTYTENTGYVTGNGGTLVIFGNANETVKTFNEKYAGAEVCYILATPVTEEYNNVDYPITYKNTTHTVINSETQPNMNITYVREGSMTDYIAGQFAEKDIVQNRKFSELSVKADSISASVTSVEGDLSETNSKVNSLETQITSQEATIKIVETHINKDDGTMAANEVTTSNGFTFNSQGLNIYVDENSYNTQINNIGTFYRDGDEIIGQTSKDGSILKDLKTQGQSQYSYDGDSYDFIEERVEVDGEYCYATFYNGEE